MEEQQQQHPLLSCPPPRELLLPQDIPEIHSRGVGQLERGGKRGGQEVKSQQGMECKCTGDKEFGAHGEYNQSRYPQTDVQKDREGVIERDSGRGKAKDRVRMEEGWGSNTQSVTKFGF